MHYRALMRYFVTIKCQIMKLHICFLKITKTCYTKEHSVSFDFFPNCFTVHTFVCMYTIQTYVCILNMFICTCVFGCFSYTYTTYECDIRVFVWRTMHFCEWDIIRKGEGWGTTGGSRIFGSGMNERPFDAASVVTRGNCGSRWKSYIWGHGTFSRAGEKKIPVLARTRGMEEAKRLPLGPFPEDDLLLRRT